MSRAGSVSGAIRPISLNFRVRSCRSAEHTCCATLPTSPEAPGKPRRASVDAALAPDKVPQWLIQVFEFHRISQHTGPFAPRPVIDLVTICRTINYGREWFGLSYRVVPSQAQCPICTVGMHASFLISSINENGCNLFERAGIVLSTPLLSSSLA